MNSVYKQLWLLSVISDIVISSMCDKQTARISTHEFNKIFHTSQDLAYSGLSNLECVYECLNTASLEAVYQSTDKLCSCLDRFVVENTNGEVSVKHVRIKKTGENEYAQNVLFASKF